MKILMKEKMKEEIVEEKTDIQPEQATEDPVLENQEPAQEAIDESKEKMPDIPDLADEKAEKSEPPKIPTNCYSEEKPVESEKNWKTKLKSLLISEKDEHGKEYLKNVLILFGINFVLLLLYQLYNDINYYHNFGPNSFIGSNMRLGELILFDAYISGYFSICQTVISALVLLPTYKFKIKNRYRILIAWVITFALSIVWVINNLVVLF